MLSADDISEAINWRRHLHRHPELSLEEFQTTAFIAERLSSWGIRTSRFGPTGIVGTLSRGSARREIALRADIDALPIQEETGLDHASSKPAVMHACGHDGHTAMLLAAASHCARVGNFSGTVHFIFQPAEESEGGARRMIEAGLFRAIDPEAVYALHNWPMLDMRSCVARDGAMMAALAIFDAVVQGHGAHAASPHEGTDPVVAVVEIVSALRSIVSRSISPLASAVLSVTKIHGGDAWNVIPNECRFGGTARWFDRDVGDLIERRLRDLIQGIAAAHGCRVAIDYQRRYPATTNEPFHAARLREVAALPPVALTVTDAPPSMASEDFSFMLDLKPGAYLWLGAKRDGENPGLHSPRYDFNDAVLPSGAALWIALIERCLPNV